VDNSNVAPGPVAQVDPLVAKLTEALLAPFDPSEVKFKPAVVSGTRALALAYVDARVIQDRLDEVLGISGWQDEYEFLPDGSVVCRLRCKIGSEWITKTDVGGQSEQPDEGDRRKAAVSDALKRAAVKFGVGRYLYRLPQIWVDYDPQKRQFKAPPKLPLSALPAAHRPAVGAHAPGSPAAEPVASGTAKQAPKPEPELAKAKPTRAKSEPATPKMPDKTAESPRHGALPANGVELQQRLYAYDAQLAKQGVCRPGELVKHVVQAGVKAGYEADLATWAGAAIQLAVNETKAFEAKVREHPARQKDAAA
jgi:hypothetical protein